LLIFEILKKVFDKIAFVVYLFSMATGYQILKIKPKAGRFSVCPVAQHFRWIRPAYFTKDFARGIQKRYKAAYRFWITCLCSLPLALLRGKNE